MFAARGKMCAGWPRRSARGHEAASGPGDLPARLRAAQARLALIFFCWKGLSRLVKRYASAKQILRRFSVNMMSSSKLLLFSEHSYLKQYTIISITKFRKNGDNVTVSCKIPVHLWILACLADSFSFVHVTNHVIFQLILQTGTSDLKHWNA